MFHDMGLTPQHSSATGRFEVDARRRPHDLLETAFSENWLVARDYVKKITGLLSEIIAQGHRDGEFVASDPEFAAVCSPQRQHPVLASPPDGRMV